MYVSYGVNVAVAVAVYVLFVIYGMELYPLGIFAAMVNMMIFMSCIGVVSKSI